MEDDKIKETNQPEMDYKNSRFYFCSLRENDKTCPKMNECKRYAPVKDIPFDQYNDLGFARLYNICNEDNEYRMFLELK